MGQHRGRGKPSYELARGDGSAWGRGQGSSNCRAGRAELTYSEAAAARADRMWVSGVGGPPEGQ
jgi:hypothetical protein